MKIIKFLLWVTLLLSSHSQAAITYVHTDHLGSVVAESNQAGQITKRLHYKPFGETIETQQDDVGYTGHKHDTDLALTYMQARYYDPALGRFYGNDPVGFTGAVDTFNRYAYVGNNPINNLDPSGKIALHIGRLSYAAGRVTIAPLIDFGIKVATAGAVLSLGDAIYQALNESTEAQSSEAGTENKGQYKPEVGECPTCGGETSNKPGKIANDHEMKPKEVKEKIHELKGGAKIDGNPDVEVCSECGEVFPQTEEGELGDSIGNIREDEF